MDSVQNNNANIHTVSFNVRLCTIQ